MTPTARFLLLPALTAAGIAAAPDAARAHPHIFAEASLEVAVNETGNVEALRHVWRFDDLFSATVLMQFDTNGDLELDAQELETIGQVIRESLADFGYFQIVTASGKDVTMSAPERIVAMFEDQQLVIVFESAPETALALDGKLDFGVYDPTFYTAIDFYEDDSLTVTHLPSGCERHVVRPDIDEVLRQNQDTLTDAFFNDPTGVDTSKLFATRLELDCTARG